MVQLAQTLFPGFMLDSIAKEIADIGDERAKKYEALANKLIEHAAKQDAGLSSVIAQQAQQSISEAGSTEDESKWWQWELRAKLANDPAKKKATYEKGIQKLPNSAELHGNYANFLADQCGDYDTAETMYKRALALDPNNANYTGNYAIFLADQRGEYDAAEAMYKRALELDPNNANYTGNYAIFLADQRGDYDAAEAMYKRALELDPNNAQNIGNYAAFLANQPGDYDATETMYKRALELDPNNANYTVNYAIFLTDQRGDYDAAEAMYKRALELDPNNAHNTGSYATFLANQHGDYDAAEAMYKRAIEADPSDTNNLANYAALLLARDKPEDRLQANIIVKRAVEISKKTPSQTLAELLLYHCLLEELTSAVVSRSVGRLKKLLEMGYKRGSWDFSKLLNTCLPQIAVERHDFYRALASAILDTNQVAGLDDFSWWRDASEDDPFTLQ